MISHVRAIVRSFDVCNLQLHMCGVAVLQPTRQVGLAEMFEGKIEKGLRGGSLDPVHKELTASIQG